MDKIAKALRKLTPKEQSIVKQLLERIQREETFGMDLQRLKGHENIFRVRKGDVRILFMKTNLKTTILAIERRSEKTYRDY